MKVYITEEELSKERTANEFIQWIDDKSKWFDQQEGGTKAVRLKIGLCKQLAEEAYALNKLLKNQHDTANKTYQCVIRSQNYDVIIRDKSGKIESLSKLEITQAHEGEVEHHRMILLEEKGSVSAAGKIKKTGTKKTGLELEDNHLAFKHEDLLKYNLKLIKEAFDKKKSKPYGEDTSLLIMFKDDVTFRDDNDIQRLHDFVEVEICRKNTKFQNIYLVSWSGEIYIHC